MAATIPGEDLVSISCEIISPTMMKRTMLFNHVRIGQYIIALELATAFLALFIFGIRVMIT